MKKLSTLMNSAKARLASAKDAGFSLIELVVAISIMIILTALGLLGYSAITKNARQTALASAAADVYTAAYAAENDQEVNADGVDAAKAASDWNSTADGGDITVSATVDADGYITVKADNTKGQTASKTDKP